MANSSTVSANGDALADQYNNLRMDAVSSTASHDHEGINAKTLDYSACFSSNPIVFTGTAGEAINRGQPVYKRDSDSYIMLTAASGTESCFRFLGFAVNTASASGSSVTVQQHGINRNQSGLTHNRDYYIGETSGTIHTTPGTYKYKICRSLDTTSVEIARGSKVFVGRAEFTTSTTKVINCGFRPDKVTIFGGLDTEPDKAHSTGVSTENADYCTYFCHDTAIPGYNDSKSWYLRITGGQYYHEGVCDTFTDTSFRLNNTKSGALANAEVVYIAESS